MTIRYEAVGLAPKGVVGQGVTGTLRVFNAGLSYVDGTGARHAYLLDAHPNQY